MVIPLLSIKHPPTPNLIHVPNVSRLLSAITNIPGIFHKRERTSFGRLTLGLPVT